MAAGRRSSPRDVLAQNRRTALARSQQARKRLQRVLGKAHEDIKRRLRESADLVNADGSKSFTHEQLRALAAQVSDLRYVLAREATTAIVDVAKVTALDAATSTIRYVEQAERAYAGTGRGLALKTAGMFDRVTRKTESSILKRIRGDRKHPARPGVVNRYSDRVVKHFEETLQLRLVARQPWDQVRRELIEGSDFLKGQPLHWAERIARTETMAAHNRASYEATVAVAEELGDMVRILSATFDDRTGSDSFAVHGQIRRVGEPFDWWGGSYMQPPNRPNDREIVVPFRTSWPIPDYLKPRSDSEVAARWAQEKRKGSPPPRPKLTTVPLELFGKPPDSGTEKVVKPRGKKPEEGPPPAPKKAPRAVSRAVAKAISSQASRPLQHGSQEHRQVQDRLHRSSKVLNEAREIPSGDWGEVFGSARAREMKQAMGEFRDAAAEVVQSYGLQNNNPKSALLRQNRKVEMKPVEMMPNALGTHEWDGKVTIRSDVMEQATRALSDAASGKNVSSRDGRSLKTVFHEEVHEHSRTSMYSYRGAAGALEEACTELASRRMTADFLGWGKMDEQYRYSENPIHSSQRLRGSYEAEISGLRGVVHAAVKAKPELAQAEDTVLRERGVSDVRYRESRAAKLAADRILEQAVMGYFTPGKRFAKPDDALKAFVKHLPQEIRETVFEQLKKSRWWSNVSRKTKWD